ncbi:hypothetical protein [Micromonospora sediminicola]|uniref:hypothetical protein n=1 Tax=Micromonospora sediminicola TaxID=946078 RepID=UPI00379E8CF5
MVVEIAPGADPAASPGTWSWQDITSRVRVDDRIEMVTGRQNEASLIDPARCSMRLDNTSGDFTPRNPYGQWYGRLGRNTPLRVRIRRGQDAFGRTASNGWGTADSGQAWTVATNAPGNFSVSGGVALMSHPSVNVLRRIVLDTSLVDVEQMFDVATPALLTGAALVTGAVARHSLAGPDYYWLRVEFKAGTTEVMLKISRVVGGTFTDVGVLDPVPGLAYAAGVPLRVRASVVGNRLAMKVWTASGTEPAGWHLQAVDDAITGPGQTGIQSWLVSGNTNTLPLAVSFDNYSAHVDRFCGFVSSWPPRWDPTGNDSTVQIQADGVLRRLSQGSPPARSPLRRTIAATAPAAYWPGEDGTVAKQLASAVAGHPAMTVTGSAAFVQVADAGTTNVQRYGSSALVNLAAGGRLAADVPGEVTLATATRWTVHVRADVDPAIISGNFVVAEWTTPGGTWVRWQIVVTALDSRVIAYTAAGSATTMVTGSLPFGLAAYAVTAEQVGGNIFITYWPNTPVFIAGALAGVSSIASNPTGVTATDAVTVGHFAVWPGITVPYNSLETETDAYGELIQSVGLSARYEAAHLRLARLCAEDGVQLTMPAVAATGVARMGWQPAGTPLDLYRQCEATDQGVLHELGFGLAYLPRDLRYNRATALTLNYAAGQVAPPFEPVDDDQLLRNRVTVRRIDGSEATAQDTASVATAGPYEQSVDVSISVGSAVANDDRPLLDHASWRVHVGATPVMRWPAIRVNLARSPELVDAVLSARVQSRMTVVNPPAQAVGDDIDVLLEGYAETIGYREWAVTFNTSPAAVWDIATVDGQQRVAADGSALAEPITAGATSLLLSSTALNGPWTTDASDMPLDVRVGGERVTVSSIAASVVDGFTRTVSSGWGSADTGQAWSTSGGSASDYSVGSGLGQVSNGSVNVLRHVTLPATWTDADVTVDVSWLIGQATGAPATAWLLIGSDLSNYYAARIDLGTSPVVGLALLKRVGGTLTSLPGATASAGAHSGGDTWRLRLTKSGPTLTATVANTASTASAVVSATDADLAAGVIVGVISRLEGGNTNTLPVACRFDNLVVASPQLVTVSARAVNGVSRAWPAGTEVDVWVPAIVGL